MPRRRSDVLDLAHDPAPAVAGDVRPLAHRAVELRRQHDLVATTGQRLADDRLRLAARVHVGGVDEVDPGVEGAVDDRHAVVVVAVAHRPEHHRPEAQLADLDPRVPQRPMSHRGRQYVGGDWRDRVRGVRPPRRWPEQDAVRARRHPPVARRRPGGGVQRAAGARRARPLDDDAVRWDGLGPWKRVVVCADGRRRRSRRRRRIGDRRHDPRRRRRAAVDEIAADWHVHVEDDGELSVRGPDLKTNVADAQRRARAWSTTALTPEQARERRALQLAELREGRPPDDVDELHFAADAPHGEPSTITPHRPVRRGGGRAPR